SCDPGTLRNLGKGAVAVVVVQPVLTVIGDEKVFVAIVVDIGNAGALAPARVSKTRLARHIREGPISVVAVQMTDRLRYPRGGLELPPVYQEQIDVAVAIVIDERQPAAVHFQDVFFANGVTRDIDRRQPG